MDIRTTMQYMLFISVVSGGVILLVLILTPALSKKYKRKWRYYVWIILGVRMILPIDFSIDRFAIFHPVSAWQENSVSQNKVSTNPMNGFENNPIIFSNEKESMENLDQEQRTLGKDAKTDRNQTTKNYVDGLKETAAIPFSTGFIKVINWLEGILGGTIFWLILGSLWAIVAVIKLGYELVSYHICRKKLLKNTQVIFERKIQMTYQEVAEKLKVDPPALRYCPEITTPMMLGVFEPMILLPPKTYKDQQLIHIFVHELYHYKRLDNLVKLMFTFVCIIHWYLPMVYWMRREVSKDIEILCDEKCCEKLEFEERKKYNQTILTCMSNQGRKYMAYSNLGNNLKQIKERMKESMNMKKRNNGWSLISFVLMLVLVVSATVSCGSPNEGSSGLADTNIDRSKEVAVSKQSTTNETETVVTVEATSEDNVNGVSNLEKTKPEATPNNQYEQGLDERIRTVLTKHMGSENVTDEMIIKSKKIIEVSNAAIAEGKRDYIDLGLVLEKPVEKVDDLGNQLLTEEGSLILRIESHFWEGENGLQYLEDTIQREVQLVTFEDVSEYYISVINPKYGVEYLPVSEEEWNQIGTMLKDPSYEKVTEDYYGSSITLVTYTEQFTSEYQDLVRQVGMPLELVSKVVDRCNLELIDMVDMTEIVSATMYYEWSPDKKYTIDSSDSKSLGIIEAALQVSNVKGAIPTGCPFDGILMITNKNGEEFVLRLATDSCNSFKLGFDGVRYFQIDQEQMENIWSLFPNIREV